MAKNVGAAERWVRLIGGGVLMLVGLRLVGWVRWVSVLGGLALVLTSALRH